MRATLTLLLLSLIVTGCSDSPAPAEPTNQDDTAVTEASADGLSAEDIALNNRGVALMGYFDYSAAFESFSELVERRPDWHAARLNLAIAQLNRQQEGDERAALALADQVLAEDPGHLRAHYIAGLMRFYLGEVDAALAHFRTVVEGDDSDAHARYFLAQALVQKGTHEEAVDLYREAIERDPYMRSAYYAGAQLLRRQRDREGAMELLNDYQRMADNPRAHLAEFKYTKMGPKAEAIAVGGDAPARIARPDGPLVGTGSSTPMDRLEPPYSITSVDIDGDGDQDTFVTGSDQTVLFLTEGGYRLRVGSGVLSVDGDDSDAIVEIGAMDHPLVGIEGVIAAAWGDVDNDGRVDVYLCRRGADQLWYQTGDGWTPASSGSGLDADGACEDVALFDADHDGDLDVFVVHADGPDELFNNDGDGSFRRLAADRGLDGGVSISHQVIPADLDADGDLDIVVLGQRNRLYLNDRLWDYTEAALPQDFESADIVSAVAADIDADGRVELITLSADGAITEWSSGLDGMVGRVIDSAPFATDLAIADLSGDGARSLILWGDGHLVSEGALNMRSLSGPGAVALQVQDPARGPDLLLLELGDSPALMAVGPGPGRYPFVTVDLSGKEEDADSMRSNRSAIGAKVEARQGSRWTVLHRLDESSGPGQSLQPMVIGTGGADKLDYIAITWPDGVFQTELDLQAGERYSIAETQRQLSSCPVIFAWDGEGYRFVSDVLGVGGIGFMIAPGEYAQPRPWERFLMPEGSIAPRDGFYEIKVTEPMQEVAYLDHAALTVHDLPPGWDLVLDERMGTGGPAPTGRPIFFRERLAPARVVNDRGRDVSEAVAAVDRVAAPITERDPRFIGRTLEHHSLTLEFDAPISGDDKAPVLVADGWVEYPYSQTVFAAWQAEASYEPATVEYRIGDGDWQLLYRHFGYPAGMPREMALPLAELPAGVTALRLTSNLELYWDRIGVVFEETAPEDAVERRSLPASARLAKTGFPLRSTAHQRLPHYDYELRQAFWDTEYPEGLYTALGPVTELVAGLDDAVVTVGPGEEAHLEFSAVTEPLPEGWTRRIVFESYGWAKDMDLYTQGGGQVGPLPYRGESPDPARDQLHEKYKTRFQGGR